MKAAGGSGPPPRGARGAGQGEDAEVLRGTVERVTYADPDSQYTVLRLAPEEGCEVPLGSSMFRPGRVTAVGRAPEPAPGLRLRLAGRWEQHATHGLQFAFDTIEVLPPADAAGLARYLASDAFEGVGETLAARIVEALGVRALERIAEDPACLAGVRGLRPHVADKLAERVRAELGVHRTHAFLRGLGLGPAQTAAVVRALGPDCEAAVRADPYVLAEKVGGIGFGTADRVASALGLAPDDPRRLRAALAQALARGSEEGHTLLERAALLDAAREVLGGEAPGPELEAALEDLARERRVVVEPAPDGERARERVYLPWLAASEGGLARNLAQLLGCAPVAAIADARALADAERASGLELSEDQRAAVLGLLHTPVGLLTGGPGVGKTTIVRLVVALAEAAGARVALASPTGRAAKRLAEATGRDASTIHRLLGFEPVDGGFEHDDQNPLERDLVVVDEISMLDVVLAHHLVKAVQPPTRLVMVGDPDQLPSVGPGNVLSDLIASGAVPLHRLRRIFRQAEGSLIVRNAHRILNGESPELPGRSDAPADFYFFPAEGPQATAERLVEVVTERIPRSFGLDWLRDVQVIAPMYRGDCGVDALNERLGETLGGQRRELHRGGRVFREGDRVIHTRNDYDKEVFNGDMGRVARIADDGQLVVAYPEREVVYSPGELSDLQPAFAITVHRSQGGEFPAVVMPLVTQHAVMLQRNLLYTAVTRARRLVVLVGSLRALRMAIDNVQQGRRESALAEKLRAATGAEARGPAAG